MKKVYEALNSKLAKAIMCSVLGLYVIYLVILTISLKTPFDYLATCDSIFFTSLFVTGFLDPPLPCEPTAYGIEQILIFSLILLFTLINLFTDRFDDHEIIRTSLSLGAFYFLFIHFFIYAQNSFVKENFLHLTWFFPVMIINGILLLFTLFKMILSFKNRKIVFHRFFIEYGCFILGIIFSALLFTIPRCFVAEGEHPVEVWFYNSITWPFFGIFIGYIFGGMLCPVLGHGIVITTIFAFVLMIVGIVKTIKKKVVKTKLA